MSDSVVIGVGRVLTFPLKTAPVYFFLEYVDKSPFELVLGR
jgi:hypothetical protein